MLVRTSRIGAMAVRQQNLFGAKLSDAAAEGGKKMGRPIGGGGGRKSPPSSAGGKRERSPNRRSSFTIDRLRPYFSEEGNHTFPDAEGVPTMQWGVYCDYFVSFENLSGWRKVLF